jgi:hypothetical protein
MSWQPPDEIRFQSKISGGLIFLGILAIFFTTLGWTHDEGWYFVGGALGAIVITAWLSLPGRFSLRFYPDRLEHRPSGLHIPYEEITELRLSDRAIIDANTARQANYFVIGHSRGTFQLPHHPSLDRLELYRWLAERAALLTNPVSLPGRLNEVRTAEMNDFGANQVLATLARSVSPGELVGVKTMWLFVLALFVATIVAVFLEAEQNAQAGLGGFLGFMIVVALLVSAVRGGQRRTLNRLRDSSGLVISPRSLTMESPALKGTLRWAEVKEMSIIHKRSALVSGILLKIEGGQILIGDHYRCPLTEIHRRIEAYLAHEK